MQKRWLALFPSAALALCLAQSQPTDEKQYEEWMKEIGKTAGSLRKNLDAKSDAASTDAVKLAGLFERVHAFWKQRNTEDAIKFSVAARDGFQEVGKLATDGKFDEAAARLKQTSSNCAACHAAHREKTEDGFKIK